MLFHDTLAKQLRSFTAPCRCWQPRRCWTQTQRAASRALCHSTQRSSEGRGAVVASCSVKMGRRWQQDRQRQQQRCRASILESEEPLSLGELQAQLDAAIDEEDYATAASLRDELSKRQSDNRLGVEEANRRFYEAFTTRSQQAMETIWGTGEHVQVIHPAAGCIAGRTQVLQSWQLVLRGGTFRIRLEDVRVFAADETGFVTCIEVVEAGDTQGRVAATNVFEKQKGRWVIVHHHGSPAPQQVL